MEAALWRSDAAFASLATFPLVAAGGFWYLPVVDEMAFRKLVSGERRGPAAAGFRYVLWLMQWPYRAVIGARNLGYRLRIFPSHSVEARVISVGNLTTGGTGKTPLVAWLAEHLRKTGHRVGLLSRGYRGEDNGTGNDEKKLLEALCGDIPHVQDPDRVSGADQAINAHECNVLILDDGFQHRRLGRDLDIVLVDATCPFGFGHLLPRGLLREPIASLGRSSIIVLTRVAHLAPTQRDSLKQQVMTLAGHDRVAEATFPTVGLVNADGSTQSLEELSGARVAAFCGIGNPEAFFDSLSVIASRAFPDHHLYTDDDLDTLARCAAESGAALLLTTRKDLVKIPRRQLGRTPLWAGDTGLNWVAGFDVVEQGLEGALLNCSPKDDRSSPAVHRSARA